MSDQQHVAPFAREAGDLHMHLRDQRAGGIEDLEPPPLRFLFHRGRHTVGGKMTVAPSGLVQFLDEHGTQGTEPLDHGAVVYHLVPHMDRRAEQGDRAFHDLDGSIDAGAEAPGVGKQDAHRLGPSPSRPQRPRAAVSPGTDRAAGSRHRP